MLGDTENSLGIPTVYKQGTMTIELHGRVNLLLDVHLEDQGTFADWRYVGLPRYALVVSLIRMNL